MLRILQFVLYSYIVYFMVYFGVMIDFLHNPEKKTELEMYYQYIKQISKEDLNMEL